MKKFLFYSDPGHGYLRVPMSILEELNITNKISNFSFKSKRYAFLEEDLDANTFISAWQEAGNTFEAVSKVIDYPAGCRYYERFAETAEFIEYRKAKWGF